MTKKLINYQIIEEAIKSTLVISNPESIKWTLKKIKEGHENKTIKESKKTI